MSRDPYSSSGVVGPGGGTRSPRSGRRVGELPTVDRSPSRSYASGRGSPLGRKRGTRSGNNSPEHLGYGSYHHHQLSSPFYSRDEDLGSPVMLEERGRSMSTGGGGHHRSRSASRPAMSSSGLLSTRYTSLDRASAGILDHDREFVPIREPRERSRDRGGLYLDDDLYGSRSARQSPNPHMLRDGGMYIGELQHQNNDLQRELGNLKKELELTNQKLGSSMHSIKTFWSPELKKERALRKEESTKYSLINEQLKLLNSENQKQSMMVRQLEEELRLRMRVPNVEVQHEMQVLYNENEHLTREIAILRDTIKELELRIETQKQTLQARDESIKKLLEMLQNKGMGKEEERIMFQQMQSMAQKQLDELRTEVQRRDQEILGMSAKMKTLEEQHQDYQRHIAVLKESLCAKEEHYNMLQADVEEMRQRLEEKNRLIEKKTQNVLQVQQERNRMNTELTELKDHMDIKDRKINVLQRKIDLHEANKKLQAGATKPGVDINQERKQLDDQRRQLEEQRKQVEERARMTESRIRAAEEKERMLQNVDQDLKKRKAKMDQLEQQLQKSGGSPDKRIAEMQKTLDTAEKELERAKEEAGRSSAETERLLQLVQMTQEEQNSKEKQIRELQDALKTAQAKLKQATTAQQQEIGDGNVMEKITDGISINNVELWKHELRMKDTKIRELESEMISIENFFRDHVDTKGILELKNIIQKKTSKIRKLEDIIEEFEDFLKQNPDVKELRDLKRQVNAGDRRIRELENWIGRNNDMRIDNTRIIELEEMVTHLEEYVKSHNVDALKQKLQDREERIDQLKSKIDCLEKEIMRREPLKNIVEDQCEYVRNNKLNEGHIKSIECALDEKEQKIKEMEHTIFEKDNRIQNYEQQIVEWQDKIEKMTNKMAIMEKEIIIYEAEDIGVLKEEIKVRDERIQQLEGEVDSLEHAFNDRIDLEQIEELLNVIKDKEEREKQINNDLERQKIKNEELKEALKFNVSISAENERKFNLSEKAKKYALDKIIKLEQRITLMQSASVLKCHTCKPLIAKLSKCEKKLKQLTSEKTVQLKELHQLKREALKTTLSEKDAHLALLELSGVKTLSQSNQVEKLRAEKEKLLDRLKKEDRMCIELSEGEESSDSTSTASTLLLTKILEPTLINEGECLDHISTVNNYDNDQSTESVLEPTTFTLNANIHTNSNGEMVK